MQALFPSIFNPKLLILGTICLFLCIGCNQKNNQNEAQNESTTRLTPSQMYWNSASSTLQKITLSDTAIVRNIRWLQPLDSVKETVELSESQPTNGRSYSLYLDDSDLNFVDIVYQTNPQNQVIKIDFDIYVEDREEVSKLISEFEQYFQIKYGSKTLIGKKSSWLSKNKTRIQLEDVSTSKDPGIKLMYSIEN
jgi:hypothetical protein